MNKAIVVVDSSLSVGMKANIASVLSLSLGACVPDLVGELVVAKDGYPMPGITTIPISILQTQGDMIKSVYEMGLGLGLKGWVFSDCAARSKNYNDYSQALLNCNACDMDFLGILVFGDRKSVNKISGNLQLVR